MKYSYIIFYLNLYFEYFFGFKILEIRTCKSKLFEHKLFEYKLLKIFYYINYLNYSNISNGFKIIEHNAIVTIFEYVSNSNSCCGMTIK